MVAAVAQEQYFPPLFNIGLDFVYDYFGSGFKLSNIVNHSGHHRFPLWLNRSFEYASSLFLYFITFTSLVSSLRFLITYTRAPDTLKHLWKPSVRFGVAITPRYLKFVFNSAFENTSALKMVALIVDNKAKPLECVLGKSFLHNVWSIPNNIFILCFHFALYFT